MKLNVGPASKSPRVTLDGQSVKPPEWVCGSVPALQAYLEGVAAQNDRVLWSLHVDGAKICLSRSLAPAIRQVQASTISLDEFCQHLVASGQAKVKALQEAIESAVLTVVINDWSAARQLWRQWQPLLREPLYALDTVRELVQSRVPASVPSSLLTRRIDEIGNINAQVESLFLEFSSRDDATEGLVEFSEILEQRLIPWLHNVSDAFAWFHEKPSA